MKTTVEEKNIDKQGGTYTLWTRIYAESDDGKKKATILVGASRQYRLYYPGVKTIEDFPFDKWIEDVVDKWKNLGDKIFEEMMHYDVYANNIDGEDNVRKFLRGK